MYHDWDHISIHGEIFFLIALTLRNVGNSIGHDMIFLSYSELWEDHSLLVIIYLFQLFHMMDGMSYLELKFHRE